MHLLGSGHAHTPSCIRLYRDVEGDAADHVKRLAGLVARWWHVPVPRARPHAQTSWRGTFVPLVF